MSRSKRGGKPGGFEYWSRRPNSSCTGKKAKVMIHQIERAQAKALIQEELKQL